MSFVLLTLACSSGDKSAGIDRYDPEVNAPNTQETDSSVWSAELQINEISSSSKLSLSWNTVEHDNISLFQLEIIDQFTGAVELLQLASSLSQVTIENRKAQTLYTINIEACLDDACSLRLSVHDNEIEAQTKPQRWGLQGSSIETMTVLTENVELFSAGPPQYQSASDSLADLWTYQNGVLEVYPQMTHETWDSPISSCWDSSCFTAIQQLQIDSSSLFILDSENTIYSQTVDVINRFENCTEDCSSEMFYTSPEEQLDDFFYLPEKDIFLWEGTSLCQDTAIFLAESSDNIWRNHLNAAGCPKPIVHAAHSPRILSTQNQDLLYFQKSGNIQFLYAKDNISQWEDEENARTLLLEWDDGTEVEANTLRVNKLAFASEEQMYLSFQPAEASNDQAYALTVASLLNP